MVGRGGGQFCGTEPLLSPGICVHVDSVRIELNCRTASWCQNCWCGGPPPPPWWDWAQNTYNSKYENVQKQNKPPTLFTSLAQTPKIKAWFTNVWRNEKCCFMKVSFHGHNRLHYWLLAIELHVQLSSLPRGLAAGAERSTTLITAWPHRQPAPIPRWGPRATSLTWGRKPFLLSYWEITEFLEVLCQKWRQRSNTYFLL